MCLSLWCTSDTLWITHYRLWEHVCECVVCLCVCVSEVQEARNTHTHTYAHQFMRPSSRNDEHSIEVIIHPVKHCFPIFLCLQYHSQHTRGEMLHSKNKKHTNSQTAGALILKDKKPTSLFFHSTVSRVRYSDTCSTTQGLSRSLLCS